MREELSNLLNKSTSKEIVLELSTGIGKSKLALEFINKHYSKNAIFKNILIVCPVGGCCIHVCADNRCEAYNPIYKHSA